MLKNETKQKGKGKKKANLLEILRDVFSLKISVYFLKTRRIRKKKKLWMNYIFPIQHYCVSALLLVPKAIFNDKNLIKIYIAVTYCVFKRIINVETFETMVTSVEWQVWKCLQWKFMYNRINIENATNKISEKFKFFQDAFYAMSLPVFRYK